MLRRAFVIRNPVASRVSARGLEGVVTELRSAGWEVATAPTEGHGHAEELADAAAARETDVIVVYGGDGTVMQAVEGMYGSDSALGLIPGGTANLLAGNLRIPRSPVAAARIVGAGRSRVIDLGHLRCGDSSRMFAVGCGAGYDADMMAETTPAQKRRWGVGAYIGFVLRTAHRIRPAPATLTIDGRIEEHDAVSIVVANCNEIIPRLLRLGADVAVDDGMLDVVVLSANGFWGAAATVWDLFWQRESARVRRRRGAKIDVETLAHRVVQADGDLCGQTPFTATVVAGALRVMVPEPHPR